MLLISGVLSVCLLSPLHCASKLPLTSRVLSVCLLSPLHCASKLPLTSTVLSVCLLSPLHCASKLPLTSTVLTVCLLSPPHCASKLPLTLRILSACLSHRCPSTSVFFFHFTLRCCYLYEPSTTLRHFSVSTIITHSPSCSPKRVHTI